MKINRIVLVSTLKLASAALASEKNAVIELFHFWFDGKYVSAFNDILGMRFSLETDFTGGVSGDKLLGILENSRAKEVSLEKDKDNNLKLKAGSALITFALRPIEDWFWNPEVPKEDGYKITPAFINAIELTLLSVGNGKILPTEQKGITVIPLDGFNAELYSTDAITASRSCIETDRLISPNRIIIPTPFCEQIKKFVAINSRLLFDDNAIYCVGEVFIESIKSEFLLFSRLIEDDNP